jgi:glycosyltransferase involved in cell wall biosynthesis
MTHHFSVLHVITSHAWGGLELYTVALVQKLHDSGVKTAIYCLPNTKVEKEAQKLGIPVFHGIKQARISVKDILRLRSLIAKEKFDILHVHTRQDVWLASLVSLLYSKIKVIFSLYMSAPSKKDLIHRFIYKRISVITSSSEILNERIKRNFPIDANHVELLRYGRDIFSCDKNIEECEKLRSIWNTDKKQIVITTMCRLDPQKGVREIAESLLLLKPDVKAKVKIWIMGEPTLSHLKEDGSPVYEEESEKLYLWLLDFIKTKEVLNHIELIPFQKNIIPYLESTDVFALVTYKETYSLSVIDAMNHGLPVIGTNTGGTPEQVQDGVRGILVNPKDPMGIAKAITAYVENPSLQKQHGEAAKTWVQSEHNWKHTIQQLIDIYKK